MFGTNLLSVFICPTVFSAQMMAVQDAVYQAFGLDDELDELGSSSLPSWTSGELPELDELGSCTTIDLLGSLSHLGSSESFECSHAEEDSLDCQQVVPVPETHQILQLATPDTLADTDTFNRKLSRLRSRNKRHLNTIRSLNTAKSKLKTRLATVMAKISKSSVHHLCLLTDNL